MKTAMVAVFLFAAFAVCATAGESDFLPGEDGTKPALAPTPFPDRMSAYVWRNWGLVEKRLLAEVVGATATDLTDVAVQMGLQANPVVLPEWKTKGYITVLRRNWHLLPYGQLTKLLGKTREELRFCLQEDDFLWVKLGQVKPRCDELRWNNGEVAKGRRARERIASILKKEGVDPGAAEEPRFSFLNELLAENPHWRPKAFASAFNRRALFSYCSDFGDPLLDPNVGSYPEGLLQKLADRGINTIWLHVVLRTLTTDPKYPEFGRGAAERVANLNTLVKRAAKYGIGVLLYCNEPRAMPDSFFRASPEREAIRGARGFQGYSICLGTEEGKRWFTSAIRQLFGNVPGLAGLSVTTASENQTNCASHGKQDTCPHCRGRKTRDILVETISMIVTAVHETAPKAFVKVSTWAWPEEDVSWILCHVPKTGVSISATSEGGKEIVRGGVRSKVGEYSISAGGPSERSKARWTQARKTGLGATAMTLSGGTWEFSVIPSLPTMDLLAEHAFQLKEFGVDDVFLSWSVGCYPAVNQLVFTDMRKEDRSPADVLDRVAAFAYGKAAVPAVRAAWTAFSDGFREYPFAAQVVYRCPVHMGPANPLYAKPTGYASTMVGFPYDDLDGWRAFYPADVFIEQMEKVGDGFEKGCALWKDVLGGLSGEARRAAERELGTYRAARLHFRSVCDQARFIIARDSGDRTEMRRIAAREAETAKELLSLVRRDSRIGYECSNHYFYTRQDLIEKILCCRLICALG